MAKEYTFARVLTPYPKRVLVQKVRRSMIQEEEGCGSPAQGL